MLWYLLQEFEEINTEKRKFKKENRKSWVIFITIVAIIYGCIICSLIKSNTPITVTFSITLLITAILFKNYILKTTKTELQDQYEFYTNKLNKMRAILKKYNLYSKSQINYLMELNNEQKEQWKFTGDISRQVHDFNTLCIIPIVTVSIKNLISASGNENDMILISVLLISLLVIIYSIFMILRPIIISFFDKEYQEFARLQRVFQDIYLSDFSKDEKTKSIKISWQPTKKTAD